jgi:uncharacterized sulfatase
MLSAVDDGVGKIVATLRKHDLEKDTLIWVIGDNGAPLKIHKIDAPGGGPGWDGSLNDPMNGEKGMLSEGGIRVPFVVNWKGTIPGGQVRSEPVISLDVAATALALAGLPEDDHLDGVNLIPFLTNEKEGEPHEALYWRWLGQSAIRKGKWKYLRSDHREYLFDMEKDAEETEDLLREHPEKAAQLKRELESWTETLSPPGLWALKSEGMSRAAAAYFDWYIEGKRDDRKRDDGRRDDGRRDDGKRDAKPPTPKPARPAGPSDAVIFQQRDKDKNNKVTWKEFLAGRTEKVDILRGHFDRRDTDKDGVWSRDEIAPTAPKKTK